MPVSDHLGQRNLAVDRASLVEWYLRNRERSRRALRSDRSGGVLHASDRASQPDRVLRGAPAGIQRDRVPPARARSLGRGRAARAAVRARHRSRQRGRGRAAQRRVHPVAGSRRGARVRRAPPTRRFCRRCAMRRSSRIVLRCSTAKRSTRRSSTKRCTRRRCSTCGTACRTITSGSRST